MELNVGHVGNDQLLRDRRPTFTKNSFKGSRISRKETEIRTLGIGKLEPLSHLPNLDSDHIYCICVHLALPWLVPDFVATDTATC